MQPMSATDERATYEIRLRGAPPGWLRERYDAFRVSRAPAQTALFRSVASSGELDALLGRLTSLGLPLAEVHEHKLPRPGAGTWVDPRQHPCSYEVRVDGRLGETFLTFLRWRHCVLPEQTTVQVEAGPDEVLRLLAACSDLGLGIERLRRVREAS